MMPPFEPDVDQRKRLRRHRERGSTRYAYTVKTIAEAAGVSVPTVRRALAGRYGDLVAVAEFVAKARGSA